MKRKILTFFFLFVWCFIVLVFFHKNSISTSLRYTRVAEGNISQAVHALFERGFAAYKDILKGDAEEWGRVRPVHWLYYSIPFFLSMARNGDLFWVDKEYPIIERFNGDLQTHVLFLIVTISVALAALAYTSFSLGGYLWIMLMLPIFVASSQTFSENLLVYYADSQEIPQILFICLYLWSISTIVKGEYLTKKREIISIILLILSYGTKETSIVLLPTLILIFMITYVIYNNDQQEAIYKLYMRQIGYNLILTIFLLTVIYHYKSGHYVSDHFNLKDIFSLQIDYSFKALKQALPVINLMVVAIVTGLLLRKNITYEKYGANRNASEIWAIKSTLLFIGFWLIQLPWHVNLIKYYLPAFIFASLILTQILCLIQKYLWKNGFFFAAIIWIIGTGFYLYKDINLKLEDINRFYLHAYEVREAIPIITKEIADGSNGAFSKKGIAIISENYPEGPLPFMRQINKQYRLNISIGNKIVKEITASEKNYFRQYKNRRAVNIEYSDKYHNGIKADIIYLVINKNEKRKRIKNSSYLLMKHWKTSRQSYDIYKYAKEE